MGSVAGSVVESVGSSVGSSIESSGQVPLALMLQDLKSIYTFGFG